jgi:cytochrome c-type biogenesis protein CcmH/NrfG
LTEISPNHGEAWHKLGDVYLNGSKKDKERAIESYKQAIILVEGENNKAKIALTLQELL